MRLALTPRTAGRLVNRVTATADGGLTATAECPVQVQEATLAVQQSGPAARYVGRPAVWDIRVRNPGAVPVTDVVVRDVLPAEVAFQGASDGGQLTNGQVSWNLGALRPGEQRVLQLTARCVRLAPQAVNLVVASAEPGVEVKDEARLEVRGLPVLRLEVSDLDDPVEVSARTTYQIEVTNRGSLPGRQVRITAVVPKQMKVLGAHGPTAARVDGRTITFPPVESLAPQETVRYAVDVQALRAGDVRFRAELRSGTLSDPVVKEEGTTIYAVPAGAPPPAEPGRPSQAAPLPAPGSGGRPAAAPTLPPPAPLPAPGTPPAPARAAPLAAPPPPIPGRPAPAPPRPDTLPPVPPLPGPGAAPGK